MTMLEKFKQGLLVGPQDKSQTLLVWNEAKQEAPELMRFVNNLIDDKPFSDEENSLYKEKLDLYSELIDTLCRSHVMREFPTFGDQLNDYCQSVFDQFENARKYSVFNMDDGWVLVGSNSNTIKIPVVMSFYEVICDIIKKTRDDQGAFLFYLMVFNQKQVVQNVKKYWVLQYCLDNNITIPN